MRERFVHLGMMVLVCFFLFTFYVYPLSINSAKELNQPILYFVPVMFIISCILSIYAVNKMDKERERKLNRIKKGL